MKTANSLFYRTLSCRTCRIHNPVTPMQRLMLLAVIGAALGTVLRIRCPALCGSPLLTQGLTVTAEVRTLWDACCTAVIPPLVLLFALLLFAGSAFGQAAALLLLFWRGLAVGTVLCDCFLRFPPGDGLLASAVLVMPFGFATVILLANAALETIRTANSTANYLFRGIPDPDIAAKQTHMLTKLLTVTLLTLAAAGLHTLLCWVMNTWLISACS